MNTLSKLALTERILQLVKPMQLWSFATVAEDGRPMVRYVAGKANDVLELRFSTHLDSRKIKHLQRDPRIHISLGATDVKSSTWVQVEGVARISTEQSEREAFWFDGLNAYVAGVNDPSYAVIVVDPIRIELWQMGRAPEVWVSPRLALV